MRDDQWDYDVISQWTDPAEAAGHVQWTREFWTAVEPFASGDVYINHLDAEEATRIRAAYGPGYERLVALKNKFDPTNLFRMLSDVDSRIQSINDRWSQFSACMASTPVAYSLGTSSWASSPTFYAQCSELWSSPVGGFDQWAQVGSTTYLYVRGGDGIVAAEMVGNGTFGNIQTVTIWYSVGVAELDRSNVSHCVAMVYAEPNTPIFELSTGGSNIGYCGVQLKSDGTLLNVTGSAEFGPGCSSSDTSCTLANSITTPASCFGGVNAFSLPALGRKAYGTHGASAYPGGVLNTITLANTGNDDSFFGPTIPTV